jgi:hypothetical protein
MLDTCHAGKQGTDSYIIYVGPALIKFASVEWAGWYLSLKGERKMMPIYSSLCHWPKMDEVYVP